MLERHWPGFSEMLKLRVELAMQVWVELQALYAGVQPQQDPGEPSGWMASAMERERERKKERKKDTRPECAAESGIRFIFHHSLCTLSWYISKGGYKHTDLVNISSACPSRNRVCSVCFCLWESFPIDFCTLSSGLEVSRKQKSGSLMVQQVATE